MLVEDARDILGVVRALTNIVQKQQEAIVTIFRSHQELVDILRRLAAESSTGSSIDLTGIERTNAEIAKLEQMFKLDEPPPEPPGA